MRSNIDVKMGHLWGVRKVPYQDTQHIRRIYVIPSWEYIKPAVDNLSALKNIDTRKYTQLEIRAEDTGVVIRTYVCDGNADLN
jgi:predicted transcriptional regulator